MVRVFINKKRHLLALLFTILIFSIGLLLGVILTNSRTNYLDDAMTQQKIEYDRLQLQYQYTSALLKDENCPALTNALQENINNLDDLRIKLENFMKTSRDNSAYISLKKEYTLAQLRYWLLFKQAKGLCKQDTVSILYFYGTDEQCRDCSIQGEILMYLKNIFKDKLLIFALDSNLDEPIIKLLKEAYAVKKMPTILLEKQNFEGLVTKEKLKESICSYFPVEKPAECE